MEKANTTPVPEKSRPAAIAEWVAIVKSGSELVQWYFPGVGFLLRLGVLVAVFWLLRRVLKKSIFSNWLGISPIARDKTRRKEILLPSQNRLVRDIFDAADALQAGRPGRMAGLHGAWGGGKSFVVQAMRNSEGDCFHEEGGQPPKRAVIYINIWEEQREPDLHFSLVRALLSHPIIFRDCLDAYRWRLLFVPLLNFVGRLLPRSIRLNLNVSNVSLDAEMSIPLMWQDSFKAVVRVAAERDIKLIFVLDEIDRAEPALAQAAITLARRALDLPGVLVVMPYVEEQLRYKVFHPLNMVSPDLRGTMESVLDDYWRRLPADFRREEWEKSAIADIDCRKEKDEVNALQRLRERHLAHLIDLYQEPSRFEERLGMRPDTLTSHLYEVFNEKYLSWRLDVEGLPARELPAFLFDCDTVFHPRWNGTIDGLEKEGALDRQSFRDALAGVGDVLSELLDVHDVAGISLRAFEGGLDVALLTLDRIGESQKKAITAQDRVILLAVMVAVVYLQTILRLKVPGGGKNGG